MVVEAVRTTKHIKQRNNIYFKGIQNRVHRAFIRQKDKKYNYKKPKKSGKNISLIEKKS